MKSAKVKGPWSAISRAIMPASGVDVVEAETRSLLAVGVASGEDPMR